jgi:hypothetical protein
MSDIPVGSVTVSVVPDARGWDEKARKQVVEPSKRVGEEAGTEMSDAMTRKMGEGGNTAGGAFEKTLKARLRVAMDTLPKANLEADSSEIDRRLEEVRLKIKSIRDQDIIDTGKAADDVNRIMADIVGIQVWAKTQNIEIPVEANFNMGKALKTLSSIRGVGPEGATTGGLLSGITREVSSLNTAVTSMNEAVGAATGANTTVQDIVKSATGVNKLVSDLVKIPGSIRNPLTFNPALLTQFRAQGPTMTRAQMLPFDIRKEFGLTGSTGNVASINPLVAALRNVSGQTMTRAESEARAKASKALTDSFNKDVVTAMKFRDDMADASKAFETVPSYFKLLGEKTLNVEERISNFGKLISGSITDYFGLLGDDVNDLRGNIRDFGKFIAGSPNAIAGTVKDLARSAVDASGWTRGLGVARNIANVSGIDLVPGGTKAANSFVAATEKLDDTLYKYTIDTKDWTRRFANSVAQFSLRSSVRDIVSGISRGIGWTPGLGVARNIANVSGIDAIPGGTKFANLFVRATEKLDDTLYQYALDTKASTLMYSTAVAKFSKSVADWTKVATAWGKTATSFVGKFTGVSWLSGAIGRGVSGLFGRGGRAGGLAGDLAAEVSQRDVATLTKLLGSEGGGGTLGQMIKWSAGSKGSVQKFLQDFAGAGGDTESLFKQLGIKSAKQVEGDIATAMDFFSKGVGKSLGDTITGGGGDLESMIRGFSGGGMDIGKLISSFGGGGSGGAGGIVGAAGGPAASAPTAAGFGGVSLTTVLIGGLVAAAPFIGQIVGSAIVGFLGAGLAGFGIAGAIMSGKLTTPLKDMSDAFKTFMTTIGGPMVPVLAAVLDVISKTVTTLTPVFKGAQEIIAGPLQNFLTAIVKSFGLPAVAASIDAVARAFAAILNAITPTVDTNMTNVANAITKLADKITNNPTAIANFFTIVTNFIVFILNSLGSLSDLAAKLEQQWPWAARILGIKAPPDTSNAGMTLGVASPATPGIAAIPAVQGRAAVPAHAAVYDRKTGKLIHPATAAIPGVAAVAGTPGTPAWAGYQPITRIQVPNSWATAAQGPTGPPGALARTTNSSGAGTFNLASGIPGWLEPAAIATNWVANFTSYVSEKIGGGVANFFTAGNNPPHNVLGGRAAAAGLTAQGQKAAASGPDILGIFGTKLGDLAKTGADIIKGITQGAATQSAASGPEINSKITTPYVNHINDGFQTHSPSKETIPTGKDLIGGIMQGMQVAVGGLPPWIATWVVAPILTALVGDTYGFGMSGAGTTAGMQPSQQTVKVGWGIIDGLKQGITEEMIGMDAWLGTAVVQPIINYLTSPGGFNIQSPSKKTKPVGTHIIEGIIEGMMQTGSHIGHFVAKIFKGWPNAMLTFISKGLDPAKLNPAARKFFQGVLASQLTGSGLNPPGGPTSKSAQANGLMLYKYLLANLFHGNKIAAAGATAAIWGESGWNPFAVGTGGRGLIGWTPVGKISNAAFKGGMATQLPAIIDFVNQSGDQEAILEMMSAKSVSDAAWIWGKRVERYGIPDVHQQGIALASGFMKYDQGGWLPPGVTLAYNLTGQSERILSPTEMGSGQLGGNQYHAHFDGLTGAAIESHVRTAFQMMSLTTGNLQRQGRPS